MTHTYLFDPFPRTNPYDSWWVYSVTMLNVNNVHLSYITACCYSNIVLLSGQMTKCVSECSCLFPEKREDNRNGIIGGQRTETHHWERTPLSRYAVTTLCYYSYTRTYFITAAIHYNCPPKLQQIPCNFEILIRLGKKYWKDNHIFVLHTNIQIYFVEKNSLGTHDINWI